LERVLGLESPHKRASLCNPCLMRRVLFWFAFLFVSVTLFSQTLKIATFNMERVGDSPKKNYDALAQIVQRFDIVGCINFIAPIGIADIMKHMGNEWKSFVTGQQTGTNLSKEYYAYIWKSGKMRMAQSLGYFNDPKNTFVRKPYGAEFETSNSDFTLILVHITGNANKGEINHLGEVYNYFLDLVSGGNVILGGDFNRTSKDAFANLMGTDDLDDAVGFARKTTIDLHGLSSSDDHIFVNLFARNNIVNAGEYDYVPDLAAGDYPQARETISDHLPVYIELKIGTE